MNAREQMEFDFLIIGAGPAGLAAAIRLAQLNQTHQQQYTIAVIEKGAAVGAHILSGAVLEPRALNELLPDWQNLNPPAHTPVTEDHFWLLHEKKHLTLPVPPTMNNHGNYIISLGAFCRWLGEYAESLGVNIFPGFAANEILFNNDKTQVQGVITGDMGLDKNHQPTERYQPGIELHAKHTLFAEGCRGYLTEQLIQHFNLRKNSDPQTYGIGLKEVWQIDPKQHQLGRVIHTIGWPLPTDTYGGSFIYHAANHHIALGFVIGLDYKNPYLDPFQELQRFKTHPSIRPLLENAKCIAYGARALNEGGLQAIPQLSFPGGLLIGCGAGFLNVAKIKGSHTAMKSGMLAAEHVFATQQQTAALNFDNSIHTSWIYEELHRARNLRPAFHKGLWWGLCYSAFDQYLLRGKAPWTFHYRQPDHDALKPACDYQPIHYPKPDGKVTFDKLQQVFLSNTNHNHHAPSHLKLLNKKIEQDINIKEFAAPETRYCPAKVYELEADGDNKQLRINFQNCLHCKTCDIKDPRQNIKWVAAEGGDGPNYVDM